MFTEREYNSIVCKCGTARVSHAKMARIRANRAKLAAVVDPLATRQPGWVLGEAADRAAKRAFLAWDAKRKAARETHAPLRADFRLYYNHAAFRQASTSRWVDGAGHFAPIMVCGAPTATIGVYHDATPGAASDAHLVWADRKCRSATQSVHKFWIRPTWQSDVADRGIALIDGCLTVDAGPELLSGPEQGHQAVWVRQGRGTALVVEHGVIARLSPTSPWVHGPSLETALATAKRRAKAADGEARAKLDAARAARIEARDAAIAAGDWAAVWPRTDLASVQVCLVDSTSAGNCATGSRAWVARWLPAFVDNDCAPASVVLEAAARDTSSTRRMAVAAVHRAVLRSRKRAA